MTRRIRRSFGLVCVATLLSPAVTSAGVDPTPFRTGLFGIAAGQAVRVTVLNAGVLRGTINPCFNPGPMVAAVIIRDLRGAVLFKSRTGPLAGGEGAFADVVLLPAVKDAAAAGALVPGGVPPPTPARLQVRAEVIVAFDDDVSARCGGVVPTLEVFDMATGRTGFTMPFAAVMFNPQPEPPEPVAIP